MEHLESDVSLINDLNIRYEGKLQAISQERGCIQLNEIKFKGLEQRNPPEDIEETDDPNDIKSLKFYHNKIKKITLLNHNGQLTETVITSDILNFLQNKENSQETDNKQEYDEDYLFSIGIIADPQYADTRSRFNYAKVSIRRYRNALNITSKAIKIWNEQDKPLLVVCLGDIIDGLNKKEKSSFRCLKNILSEFKKFQISKDKSLQLMKSVMEYPLNEYFGEFEEKENENNNWIPRFPYFHNVIGNHELYNFNQQQLMEYFYSPQNEESLKNWKCPKCGLLNSKLSKKCEACFEPKIIDIMTPRFYYSMCPFPGYIFIFLNCYELTIMGYNYYEYRKDSKLDAMDSSHFNLKRYHELFDIDKKKKENNDKEQEKKPIHPNKQIAMDLLSKHNNGNIYGFQYTADDKQRWCMFNGGFGAQQLKWLDDELQQIERMDNEYNVILFGHIPIWGQFSDPKSGLRGDERVLCWDYKEIHQVIGKYKCVKMYLAGHDHAGQCTKDDNGIWHRTLEGAVESCLDKDCFGTMYFYKDKAVLKGYGIDSGVFPFR